MKAKIRYRWDPDKQLNRVVGYIYVQSDYSFANVKEDEIVIECDKLPVDFAFRYYMYEMKDGCVRWSALLYEEYQARHYSNLYDHIHPK